MRPSNASKAQLDAYRQTKETKYRSVERKYQVGRSLNPPQQYSQSRSTQVGKSPDFPQQHLAQSNKSTATTKHLATVVRRATRNWTRRVYRSLLNFSPKVICELPLLLATCSFFALTLNRVVVYLWSDKNHAPHLFISKLLAVVGSLLEDCFCAYVMMVLLNTRKRYNPKHRLACTVNRICVCLMHTFLVYLFVGVISADIVCIIFMKRRLTYSLVNLFFINGPVETFKMCLNTVGGWFSPVGFFLLIFITFVPLLVILLNRSKNIPSKSFALNQSKTKDNCKYTSVPMSDGDTHTALLMSDTSAPSRRNINVARYINCKSFAVISFLVICEVFVKWRIGYIPSERISTSGENVARVYENVFFFNLPYKSTILLKFDIGQGVIQYSKPPNEIWRCEKPTAQYNNTSNLCPLTLHGDWLKPMWREVLGYSGDSYFNINRSNGPPNIIHFVIESARYNEFTAGNGVTPNIDILRQRGLSWAKMFTYSFHTAASILPLSRGLFPETVKGKSSNYIYSVESVPHFLNYLKNNKNKDQQYKTALRFFQGAFTHPSDFDKNDEGNKIPGLGVWGENFRDTKITNDIVNEIYNAKKPFYYEVHTEGTHVPFPEVAADRKQLLPFKNTIDNIAERFEENMESKCRKDECIFNNSSYLSRKEIRKRYLKKVVLCDAMIGDVISKLKEKKHSANTLIMISGDHGYTITRELYQTEFDEQFHVPFIIADIDGDVLTDFTPGSTINDLASNIDIVPTILDTVGFFENSHKKGPLKRNSESKNVISTPSIGFSLRRKIPSDYNRMTFSSFRETVITRNNTHTQIFDAYKGGAFRIRSWDRDKDPDQLFEPSTTIVKEQSSIELRPYNVFRELKLPFTM